jgi:uncharacterized DUF497 family protein
VGGRVATKFEWDPIEAASHLRKHGIRFEFAARVFADPLSPTELVKNGERRLADDPRRQRSASAGCRPYMGRCRR